MYPGNYYIYTSALIGAEQLCVAALTEEHEWHIDNFTKIKNIMRTAVFLASLHSMYNILRSGFRFIVTIQFLTYFEFGTPRTFGRSSDAVPAVGLCVAEFRIVGILTH